VPNFDGEEKVIAVLMLCIKVFVVGFSLYCPQAENLG
jgi:hypothetical protein